jgi:hypothetical protein
MKKKNNLVLFVLVLILIIVSIYYFKNLQALQALPDTDVSYTLPTIKHVPAQEKSTSQVKPTITIISPNGGKVEYSKSTTIKWFQTGLNPSDSLTITFRDKDWNSCWVGKVSVGLGQVEFVPRDVKCVKGSTFNSFGYNDKYVVQVRDDLTGTSDQSDDSFTIVR